MRFFEIPLEIEHILATEVDQDTGELTPETLEKLTELDMKLEHKALAVAAYLKGERAEGDAVMQQSKHLAERAKGHFKRADSLEGYLAFWLPTGREASDPTTQIKWSKSKSVTIVDAGLIPDEYQRTRTEVKPDKPLIAKALKSGRDVEGAVLTTNHKIKVS